ncbi:regulatory protein GemA [Oscillibacter sp.]|uniref:regulatory protein GemA n=1 Tax=Oscillibacter sp. TaxID=1945593 RepID=UPI0028B08CFD|nr:regulatory protein GemA [Oscillibacter sp.]
MATAARGGRKPASIRTLWAIARSPELQLSEEDLHAIVYRETRKGSMKQLTQGEINTLARILQNMKDGVSRDVNTKRTDEGGDPRTVQLRRKIYALCGTLGWNNDNQRINAFAKRMCGVERIEWLNMAQCCKIVEALKAMAARQEAGGGATE